MLSINTGQSSRIAAALRMAFTGCLLGHIAISSLKNSSDFLLSIYLLRLTPSLLCGERSLHVRIAAFNDCSFGDIQPPTAWMRIIRLVFHADKHSLVILGK